MIDNDSSTNTNTSQNKPSTSPSGMSINWQCSSLDENMKSNVELIVGAKGIKQGKRPKNEVEFTRLSSRLSRHSLLLDSLQCIRLIQQTGYLLPHLTRNDMSMLLGHSQRDSKLITYQWTKTLDAKEDPKKSFKTWIFQNEESPLFGWVRSSKDHDFKYSH
jgi:Adenosine-deaminase (editase) domain.